MAHKIPKLKPARPPRSPEAQAIYDAARPELRRALDALEDVMAACPSDRERAMVVADLRLAALADRTTLAA